MIFFLFEAIFIPTIKYFLSTPFWNCGGIEKTMVVQSIYIMHDFIQVFILSIFLKVKIILYTYIWDLTFDNHNYFMRIKLSQIVVFACCLSPYIIFSSRPNTYLCKVMLWYQTQLPYFIDLFKDKKKVGRPWVWNSERGGLEKLFLTLV